MADIGATLREARMRAKIDINEVEARTMLAYSLFVGSYFVSARTGKRQRAESVRLAIDKLLE